MKRLHGLPVLALLLVGCATRPGNWYERSFFLLHEDHHTYGEHAVGRDADPVETARLVGLSQPDVVQIHAKGNPGWTTYPSTIGYTPPLLNRDVLGVWRDMARRDGYHFSTYYNLGRDREIMRRHPEWNRVKANGTLYDNMLCYHSGVAEAYLWPMIREIMAGYHPDGFWFDGSCFTVHLCYCDKCRARFRNELGLEAPLRPHDRGWSAYHDIQRQIYREFIHRTAAMIHQIDPKCLVAVNWAYSLRMPEKPDKGIDYLTGDIADNVSALSAEAHWYDSQGSPFDLMTVVHTLSDHTDSSGAHIVTPKPRGQIQQEMAVILANGGRYFAWDTPTPESGLVPDRLEFLREVAAPFLRSRQAWCLGSKRVPDVSLLHSAAAHYAITDQGSACFGRPDNRIDGATDALSRLHLNYEMVSDWRLARQDIQSPVLIVEHPAALAGSNVNALVMYVRSGGTLLLTGMGATLDDRLRELCGIGNCVAPAGPEQLTVELAGGDAAFESCLFRPTLSTARPLITLRDSHGQEFPLLTRNSCGRGQVFYAAVPLLSKPGKNTIPANLVESVFYGVLPPARRILATTAPDSVETSLRQKDNHCVLHLVNLAPGRHEIYSKAGRRRVRITDIPPAPPCHVSIRLPTKPAAVWLEPGNVRLKDWGFENGRLELNLPQFEIHRMVVIKNRKGAALYRDGRQKISDGLAEADMEFLRDMTRDVIEAARVNPGSSGGGSWKLTNVFDFALITPGKDTYRAFWPRDFSMSVDSGFITPSELSNHLWVICLAQNGPMELKLANGLHVPPWAIPDHINYDGHPTYYPGTYASGEDQGAGACGRVPPIDDHYAFVHIAHVYWKATGDVEFLRKEIDGVSVFKRLEKAFACPTTDARTGLAFTTEADRAVGFGFCDGETHTGKLLFASLLRYRAAGEMAELSRAVGKRDNASTYRKIQKLVHVNLVRTFADPKVIGGWLRASTEISRQPDVWGTLFALHLGVLGRADATAARKTIADAVRRGTITLEGGVRQVPTNLDFSKTTAWERSFCKLNTYQNGGYWHTATGWLVEALWKSDRKLALQIFGEMIVHLRAQDFRKGPGYGAPWEVYGPDERAQQNAVYMTSVALPYGILKNFEQ